jgi:hypothetical protein
MPFTTRKTTNSSQKTAAVAQLSNKEICQDNNAQPRASL